MTEEIQSRINAHLIGLDRRGTFMRYSTIGVIRENMRINSEIATIAVSALDEATRSLPGWSVLVFRSSRTHVAGSASSARFWSNGFLASVTGSDAAIAVDQHGCKIPIGVRSTWMRLFDRAANRIDYT